MWIIAVNRGFLLWWFWRIHYGNKINGIMKMRTRKKRIFIIFSYFAEISLALWQNFLLLCAALGSWLHLILMQCPNNFILLYATVENLLRPILIRYPTHFLLFVCYRGKLLTSHFHKIFKSFYGMMLWELCYIPL